MKSSNPPIAKNGAQRNLRGGGEAKVSGAREEAFLKEGRRLRGADIVGVTHTSETRCHRKRMSTPPSRQVMPNTKSTTFRKWRTHPAHAWPHESPCDILATARRLEL